MISAILLGLASSLHCIGMCGPLSLAIPVGGIPKQQKWLIIGLYQAGRIFTYGVVGVLAGLLGKGLLTAGLQQGLSIIAGLVILVAAIGFFGGKKARPLSFLNGFHRFLSRLLFRLIKTAGTPAGAYVFGMANGLLPCGMVYIAAITALSFGNLLSAMLFMVLFGAGTLPAMLLVAFTASRINNNARRWVNRISPYVIVAMGLLLILRGLNWGIPFVSPVIRETLSGEVSCHP